MGRTEEVKYRYKYRYRRSKIHQGQVQIPYDKCCLCISKCTNEKKKLDIVTLAQHVPESYGKDLKLI